MNNGISCPQSAPDSVESEYLLREKLSAAIEIAGKACHELSQPMQVIFGYCELMLLEVSPDHPLYGRIQIIQQEVERIATIITKIQYATKFVIGNSGKEIKITDHDHASSEEGLEKE